MDAKSEQNWWLQTWWLTYTILIQVLETGQRCGISKNVCCLRSPFESNLGIDVDEDSEDEDIAHEKLTTEILAPGTIVALAAEKKSVDTFYLIKIMMEECTLDDDALDDYGHKLRSGQPHLQGNFLEKICGSSKLYKSVYEEILFL